MNALQIPENRSIDNEGGIGVGLFNHFVSYLDASPKTVETYVKALRQLFKYLAGKGIRSPQREDIVAFRDELRLRGCKPTTIQNYISVVKIFFHWVAQNGYYPNIAEHIKGAKLNREHKKDYLTSKQVKEVLERVELNNLQGVRDYAILALMITGGLRTIEVARADVADIRNVGEATVLYIQGKGREDKADYVKLSQQVEGAIRRYLTMRGEVKDTDPLFMSCSNNSRGVRLTPRSISGIVKGRLKKAGYDNPRLTAHSLRHTAVTLALLAGKDITEVQQFARHLHISTTMIYNHALDKAKNTCNEAVTNAIFS